MAATVGKKALWGGRVASAVPVFMLVLSGIFKLSGGEKMHTDWAAFGFPLSTLAPIGVVEILCAILYVVPRTAVLGAVLVTGYLGGAIVTHVRVSQPVWVAPLVLGMLAWFGLWLRDPRLQALLPMRRE